MSVWEILRPNFHLGWNLFLALTPLGLSFVLFRINLKLNGLWWLGAIVFFAFLPNAPYVLTDIIHLFDKLKIPNLSPYLVGLQQKLSPNTHSTIVDGRF